MSYATFDLRFITASAIKIRSLWNVKNTAPYFHDNSAKTLEDVIAHYKQLFILRKLSASDQDLVDILAYLRLL
jgi:cytochrome c peroxidase